MESRLRSCSTSESQSLLLLLVFVGNSPPPPPVMLCLFLTSEAGELRLLASEAESFADKVAKV